MKVQIVRQIRVHALINYLIPPLSCHSTIDPCGSPEVSRMVLLQPMSIKRFSNSCLNQTIKLWLIKQFSSTSSLFQLCNHHQAQYGVLAKLGCLLSQNKDASWADFIIPCNIYYILQKFARILMFYKHYDPCKLLLFPQISALIADLK